MQKNREQEYARRLSRMIQSETISVSGEKKLDKFYKFHKLLREEFPSLFSTCELEDFGGSFLLRWLGADNSLEPILFMNHQDVVEASGDWTYPPFSGEIADGKVWGRGALDTKCGLFGMLEAAEELIREAITPPRDIYFLSTCTEEIGGADADRISKILLERGIRFAMVLDEGGMIVDEPMSGVKGQYAMIGVGEKGYTDLKFIARSHGGHASTPPKGSPLVRLGGFMAEAEKSRIFKVKMSPTVRATLASLSTSMSGALRFVLGHPRLFSPLLCRVMPSISPAAGAMLKTTLAFTMAEGSEGSNVLPEEAYVVGNMRYSHHQGGRDSIDAVTKLASKYDIETVVINSGFDSPLSSHKGTAFKLVEGALAETYPQVKSAPYIMNAASDSRYLSRVSDDCLRFAPFAIDQKQLASVHGVDENIDTETLVPAVDFYKYMMINSSSI